MSEPARQTLHHDTAARSAPSGPLRDWLATMRAQSPDAKAEARAPEAGLFPVNEDRAPARASRFASAQAEQQDDEVAEIVAENLMLKAKLRLEGERYDELQVLLAQEVRELREHIRHEIENLDDMRADRDLWKARCEALMQPLFQKA